MNELSLWLDSYDDIYSDFDSRHYLKRRVSEDFLYELRNALRYKKEKINDLFLLLPSERRDEMSEKIIIDSLQDFFREQHRYAGDKCRCKFYSGLWLLIAGVIVMSVNSFIGYRTGRDTFPLNALQVLLEPAGWFLIWAAMDFLFYDYKDLLKERNFYRELAAMAIHFRSSE